MLRIDERDGMVFFEVRVQPRASREEIAGYHGNALKVRLSAPPVEGAANAACVTLLAKVLGVARSRVQIVAGETARNKRLRIDGVTRAQVEQAIARALAD